MATAADSCPVCDKAFPAHYDEGKKTAHTNHCLDGTAWPFTPPKAPPKYATRNVATVSHVDAAAVPLPAPTPRDPGAVQRKANDVLLATHTDAVLPGLLKAPQSQLSLFRTLLAALGLLPLHDGATAASLALPPTAEGADDADSGPTVQCIVPPVAAVMLRTLLKLGLWQLPTAALAYGQNEPAPGHAAFLPDGGIVAVGNKVGLLTMRSPSIATEALPAPSIQPCTGSTEPDREAWKAYWEEQREVGLPIAVPTSGLAETVTHTPIVNDDMYGVCVLPQCGRVIGSMYAGPPRRLVLFTADAKVQRHFLLGTGTFDVVAPAALPHWPGVVLLCAKDEVWLFDLRDVPPDANCNPAPTAIDASRACKLKHPRNRNVRHAAVWVEKEGNGDAPPVVNCVLGCKNELVLCTVDPRTPADLHAAADTFLTPYRVVHFEQARWLSCFCRRPSNGELVAVDGKNVVVFTRNGDFDRILRVPEEPPLPLSDSDDDVGAEAILERKKERSKAEKQRGKRQVTGPLIVPMDAYGANVSLDGSTLVVADYAARRVVVCDFPSMQHFPYDATAAAARSMARKKGPATADCDDNDYKFRVEEKTSW